MTPPAARGAGGTTLQAMPEPGDVRVSDDERERVAREIREHYAAGRLDEDELNERVEAAYAARTQSELNALRADLPALPATRSEQRADVARRRRELERRLLQQSGGALVPFAICTAIWAFAGASGPFWPVWILLIALIPLVRNGWRLYGPAPELDRVEEDLARRRRGEDLRAAGAERQRLEEPRPEADVGEPRLVPRPDAQRHVRPAARAHDVAADAREEPVDRVPEALERRREQQAVLVAVAAAAPGDQLGLHALEVDGDPAAERDVEVLERDRGDVRAVERRERRRPGRAGGVVADAPQIGGQVEEADVPFVDRVGHAVPDGR